jgi:hypothetical protein
VGSGDRSERIRTYNFPQGRVTDHRINLTLYKLADIVEGNLDPVVGPLPPRPRRSCATDVERLRRSRDRRPQSRSRLALCRTPEFLRLGSLVHAARRRAVSRRSSRTAPYIAEADPRPRVAGT